MTQKNDDLEKIKQIIDIMKDNDLAEVEIKHGEDKILVKRSQPEQAKSPIAALPVIAPIQPAPAAPALAEPKTTQNDTTVEIKAPIVGTFFAQPSPDSTPYVEIGTHVDSQAVVCIIEAMKVMNEIKAELAGTITAILVPSGQAVEYGQPLFKVKPD